MPEIHSLADVNIIKWIFGSLIGVVNFLIIYIFRNFKKDFYKLRDKFEKDHDRLNKLETEHEIYHPKNPL